MCIANFAMYIPKSEMYIPKFETKLFRNDRGKYLKDQTIRRFVFTKFVILWKKHYFCTQ